MKVISTRNAACAMPALSAVLKGISEDGGLFVPEYFPRLDLGEVCKITKDGYEKLAGYILSLFFDIEPTEAEKLAQSAYSSFDTSEVVPVASLENAKILELWHGPTLAFKDMALQVLPRLMSRALAEQSDIKNVMILTATSGDTGKAALEGFCDVSRTAIVVFYPNEGVSKMQKLQMATQEGKNVAVFSVDGNFDDAQTGVKEIFADKAVQKKMAELGYSFSSANSINIGRLVPQIAYYVYAYCRLVNEGQVKKGDEINICVPTGNFGNILAAYYAKQMGVPVAKLICASNKNNVLTDFFASGKYDCKREFYKTMSPSMDILISSNLERLLFELAGRDAETVKKLMASLKESGSYEISEKSREILSSDFYADFCDEAETSNTIRAAWDEYHYLMDTHSAVAYGVYRKYVEKTGDNRATVVASTANPYKFTADVLAALTGAANADAFAAAKKLSEYTGTQIPRSIAELEAKAVLHSANLKKGELKGAVTTFAEGLK